MNMDINLHRLSAFSDGLSGGNPAGVVIDTSMPSVAAMQSLAAKLGYSETVFAMPHIVIPHTPLNTAWRARYFSPETEVPFCGHATIALGAALAKAYGNGEYALTLNDAQISIYAELDGELTTAALQSPPTRSEPLSAQCLSEILHLFNYKTADLDPRIPSALASAGASHAIIALHSREALSRMQYDLSLGRALMQKYGLVTVAFIVSETAQRFHVRNAFASGGVIEDPATGAAAAALAGYLRDIGWPHTGRAVLIQGEDMGERSVITVEIKPKLGSSIRVSGSVRALGPHTLHTL